MPHPPFPLPTAATSPLTAPVSARPTPTPSPDAPRVPLPRATRLPPPKSLSPWAWTTAVVLGQPNAYRLVRAFFLGLIGLTTVLLGAARGCR